MMVCFIQKLNAFCLCKLLKAVKNLRCIKPELLQRHSGNAVAYPELAVRLIYQVKDRLVGGQVAFFRDFLHYLPVFFIIKIVIAASYVKDAVFSKPERLVHLEIKADAYHFTLLLNIFIMQLKPRCKLQRIFEPGYPS